MTTKLADVIVPAVFTPYTVQRTMELSALFTAGIVSNDSDMDTRASGAGTLVQMPFFTDLSGDAENVVEDADLTAGKIGTSQDAATIIRRAKMWGATDLSAALSGTDPAGTIGDLVAAYWAREYQKELIASLSGVFAAANMAGHVLDISGGVGAAGVWSGNAFIDATQLLGDAKGQLTAIAVHSATESLMKKQNLIEYVQPADGGAPVPTYQGKRVVVDDGCPVAGGVYTSYLFGAGAVAFGNGNPSGFVPTEVSRIATKGSGVDLLITRKTFILHPRGIRWTAARVADVTSPTRAELADADNWTRVYEPKALRLVAFKHRLV